MKLDSQPYLIEGTWLKTGGWLGCFRWPIDPRKNFAVMPAVMERYVAFSLSLPDEERRLVYLARCLNEAATLIEAALAIAAEASTGIRLEGPPALTALRGESGSEMAGFTRMGERHLVRRIPYPTARRLMRVASWSHGLGFLSAVTAPAAMAVTHNPLLVAQARRERPRLGFYHAVHLLDKYLNTAVRAGAMPLLTRSKLEELALSLTAALVAEDRLPSGLRRRVEQILLPRVTAEIHRAGATLGALRAVRRLPVEVWSGTGGFYPARAIGLEVLRRGGRVRRFDHGGTVCLLADPNYIVQQELSVSSEYVMPTASAAQQSTIQLAVGMVSTIAPVRVSCGDGDPSLMVKADGVRSVRSKPRVLFVGTAYYSFWQTYPPFPPASIYLHWQSRVLRMLKALPIDLVHKPHPGGLFNGNPPGLAELAPIDHRPFETVLPEFDCIVFDISASTTFSVALSSNKKVVLLDLGGMKFSREVEAEILRRCHVVPVGVDEHNCFTVSEEELAEAVCSSGRPPDSTFFRAMLVGG